MVSPPPSQVLTVSHYDLEVFETAACDHSSNCTPWLRKFLRPPSSSGVESRNASPSHNRWVSTGHSPCASEKLSQVQRYSKGKASPPTEQKPDASRMLGISRRTSALARSLATPRAPYAYWYGIDARHGNYQFPNPSTIAECQLQSTGSQHQCATC